MTALRMGKKSANEAVDKRLISKIYKQLMKLEKTSQSEPAL